MKLIKNRDEKVLKRLHREDMTAERPAKFKWGITAHTSPSHSQHNGQEDVFELARQTSPNNRWFDNGPPDVTIPATQ